MTGFHVRNLGLQPYEAVWQQMCAFTETRTPETPDEIWLLEHPSIYTLGLNSQPEHILARTDIPVIQTDRGGQVTWHGPGQLIAYTLLDIRRLDIGIRTLVTRLETAVIGLLRSYALKGHSLTEAPGVYIDGRKIASVGLRIRKGCSYHGISLNVDASLDAFQYINPCGYPKLPVTSLAREGVPVHPGELPAALACHIMDALTSQVTEKPRPPVAMKPVTETD